MSLIDIQFPDLFYLLFFFFNDTATTEIYTLSLHDALPISCASAPQEEDPGMPHTKTRPARRSEEHTSELQSQFHLVCRLLLEKKKTKNKSNLLEKKKKKHNKIKTNKKQT